MTTQTERIKPCPFCGNVGLDFKEGSTFRWLLAECSNCGTIRGETRIQTTGEGSKDEWLKAAKSDAIEAWNERAALQEQAREGEAVAPGIVLIAQGEYSDYQNSAFKILKPFTFTEAAEVYKTQHVPEHEWDKPSGDGFVGWLSSNRYIEDADIPEVHVGSYGEFDVSGDRCAVQMLPAPQPAREGEFVAWLHGCNVLCADIDLWIDRCPHCGKPRPAAPAPQPAQPEQGPST